MIQQLAPKAARLRELHHSPRPLLLPNVWDPLGARLLEGLGYPAVATASAAVAWSLGYRDGERLPLDEMLAAVARIARRIQVPLSADIERGYAETPEGVGRVVRRVLDAGAVGINIEDSFSEGGALRPAQEQAERIRAARASAAAAGVPLVINARIDVFLSRRHDPDEERLVETVQRGRLYREAGADCLYPIALDRPALLSRLHAAVGAPLNVYATAGSPALPELQAAGVARLSFGPGFLKVGLTAMKRAAATLASEERFDAFVADVLPSREVEDLLED